MRLIRNIVLLIFPYLLMVGVNEAVRPTLDAPPYTAKGVTAMNSNLRLPDTCTWVGHNDTAYCKQQHVRFLQGHFATTDPIYFGMITILHASGNYGVANILLYVVLMPLVIWYALVKCIDYTLAIKRLKKNRYAD
jgi:hypothetical protein